MTAVTSPFPTIRNPSSFQTPFYQRWGGGGGGRTHATFCNSCASHVAMGAKSTESRRVQRVCAERGEAREEATE